MYGQPIQFVRAVIPFSSSCPSHFSHLFLLTSLFACPPFLLTSLLAVPIRRNLIGNQSFWGKNGAWLSITVPWVLPAERGVQKRLYVGTVVGKVNAVDSLSSALFQKEKCPVCFFSSTDKLFYLQFQNTILFTTK